MGLEMMRPARYNERRMKRALLLISLLLTACQKDETEQPTTPQVLVIVNKREVTVISKIFSFQIVTFYFLFC